MRNAAEKEAFKQLVIRVSAGDRPAFRELVDQSHGTVYRLALRILGDKAAAEDVVQETFIRAWQGLAGVREPAAAFGWICRVARNVAYDRQRSRYRRPVRSLDAPTGASETPLVEQLADGGRGPDDQVDAAQVDVAVRGALAGLKEKHRLVLTLREIDGLSYEDIAEALGCRIGTVESRLHRARKALAQKLKGLALARAEEG